MNNSRYSYIATRYGNSTTECCTFFPPQISSFGVCGLASDCNNTDIFFFLLISPDDDEKKEYTPFPGDSIRTSQAPISKNILGSDLERFGPANGIGGASSEDATPDYPFDNNHASYCIKPPLSV
jgi:hypothetical protein